MEDSAVSSAEMVLGDPLVLLGQLGMRYWGARPTMSLRDLCRRPNPAPGGVHERLRQALRGPPSPAFTLEKLTSEQCLHAFLHAFLSSVLTCMTICIRLYVLVSICLFVCIVLYCSYEQRFTSLLAQLKAICAVADAAKDVLFRLLYLGLLSNEQLSTAGRI